MDARVANDRIADKAQSVAGSSRACSRTIVMIALDEYPRDPERR